MTTLDKLTESQYKKILVYGPPKVGKTILAAKLAETFKLHWMDGENGIGSAVYNLPAPWLKNIDVIQFADTKDYPVFGETVLKVLKGKPIRVCIAHGKGPRKDTKSGFSKDCVICSKNTNAEWWSIDPPLDSKSDVLVIDSATQVTGSILNHITRGKDDEYKLQIDDWGESFRLWNTLGSYVQAYPGHVVVISHELMIKREDGNPQVVPVSGSQESSKIFAKYFGTVVYGRVINGVHRWGSSTSFSPSILTGSRENIKLDDNPVASLREIFDAPIGVQTK